MLHREFKMGMINATMENYHKKLNHLSANNTIEEPIRTVYNINNGINVHTLICLIQNRHYQSHMCSEAFLSLKFSLGE